MNQLQKNASRIKNILDGNYTSKSKIQSGYKKKKEDHVEGDIWEENGKYWTIKNGIKQTVSKLDSVRQYTAMPLLCPKCGRRMKKRLDKKFWRLRRCCFDCIIEEDTQRMIDGTFKEYEKQVIAKNVRAWIKDMEVSIAEFVGESETNRYITEDGQKEDWFGGYSEAELKEILTKQIDEFKEKAKEYIDNLDANVDKIEQVEGTANQE